MNHSSEKLSNELDFWFWLNSFLKEELHYLLSFYNDKSELGHISKYKTQKKYNFIIVNLLSANLALAITQQPSKIASLILLPAAGALVSLAFSWVGTANSLFLSNESRQLVNASQIKIQVYIFKFQYCTLVLLSVVILWCIAGLSVFDVTLREFGENSLNFYFLYSKVLLFFFAELTLYGIIILWKLIFAIHILLISIYKIQEHNNRQSSSKIIVDSSHDVHD